jgi:hypothetical protein
MMYVAVAEAAVGVPEIVPREVSNAKPAGNAGLQLYELTVPVTVGVSAGIAVPTVALIALCG